MTERGPGWGTMWISTPWRAHGDNHVEIDERVYATFDEARAAALDEWMRMPVATEGVPTALSQLRSCRTDEDVMISYGDLKDALAIYRVRNGQVTRDAGMAFYVHWRDTLWDVFAPEIMASSGALVWYGWNPRPTAHTTPPTGGSGGSSCLLIMLGLLLGLVLLGWAAS
ncbi:hypothetical protein [Kitasatospora sp. NPDC096140]|uniref:hypothetical protein n=1 Tax=Kitasatospora sp. NPDC096140 TaxID=3155425 RepID=UPI00332F2578